MIYTSYFDNVKNILAKEPNAKLISIAGRTPESIDCEKFKPLMPHYSWWKEWHDKFEGQLESEESKNWYIKQYYTTILSGLVPLDVARRLKDLAEWKRPIFILCYETPKRFCHRHLVAEWFRKAGIDCEEFVI